MSSAEQTATSASPPPPDPWQVWFSRMVQIVGLFIMIEQVIVGDLPGHHERPIILTAGYLMMLGGVGLQLFARFLLARAAG